MKRIGLALGAGGAKGLCHIAFLKVLDELGVKPAVIAGTSIGAIIGGFYAAGLSAADLEQKIQQIGVIDISKMALDFSLFSNSAILKGKGVEEFLQRLIPARTFEELDIPLKVVATDFWNRTEVVFTSGDLISAIRASMALPGIFEPSVINDTVLIDGGAVNPLPYDLLHPECDVTIAIDVSGVKEQSAKDPVPNVIENILSTFQIMQASIIAAKKKISPPSLYVKPPLTNVRVLDFHRYQEILAGVEDDAAKFAEELKAFL